MACYQDGAQLLRRTRWVRTEIGVSELAARRRASLQAVSAREEGRNRATFMAKLDLPGGKAGADGGEVGGRGAFSEEDVARLLDAFTARAVTDPNMRPEQLAPQLEGAASGIKQQKQLAIDSASPSSKTRRSKRHSTGSKQTRGTPSGSAASSDLRASLRGGTERAWECRVIDRAAFCELIQQELPWLGRGEPHLIEVLFSAFASSGSGYIDQEEFILGLSTLTGGTSEDQIRLMFQVADVDSSGSVERRELSRLLELCYRMTSKPFVAPPAPHWTRSSSNAAAAAPAPEVARRSQLHMQGGTEIATEDGGGSSGGGGGGGGGSSGHGTTVSLQAIPYLVDAIFERLGISARGALTLEHFTQVALAEPAILACFCGGQDHATTAAAAGQEAALSVYCDGWVTLRAWPLAAAAADSVGSAGGSGAAGLPSVGSRFWGVLAHSTLLLFAEVQEDLRVSQSSRASSARASVLLQRRRSSRHTEEWLPEDEAMCAQLRAEAEAARRAAVNAKKPAELAGAIQAYRQAEAELRRLQEGRHQQQASVAQLVAAPEPLIDGLQARRDLPLIPSPRERQHERARGGQPRQGDMTEASSGPVAVLHLDGAGSALLVSAAAAAVVEEGESSDSAAGASSDDNRRHHVDGYRVTVQGAREDGRVLGDGSDMWVGSLELGCTTEEEALKWRGCLQQQSCSKHAVPRQTTQ
jgi:hypothetical protein